MGILEIQERVVSGYTPSRIYGTYPDPSTVFKSIVLVGAMTKNGILCLAARTAALYVPIYSSVIQRVANRKLKTPSYLVGCVSVLGDPICTNDWGKVNLSDASLNQGQSSHTNGVDFMVLE